jgi:hypothetical protein
VAPRKKPTEREEIQARLRAAVRAPLDENTLFLRVGKILAKQKAGKLLSKREQLELDNFGTAGAPDRGCSSRSSPNEEWVSSDAKLSALFGPHRASFPRFRREHQDAPRPRANGDHSVSAWRAFFAAHPELLGKCDQAKTLSRLETRDAIEAEDLRKKKFDNDRKEGLYLPRASTSATLGDLAQLQKSTLRSALEDELPPIIQNQPAAAIRSHMKLLVDRLCRQFGECAERLLTTDKHG